MLLSDLGERICILGPSNSGKSTMAYAIGRKCDLPVVHLDRLFHLPDTDWQPRPASEFTVLHDRAIANDRWVIDGNYSALLPQRLLRATGLILLDVCTITSVFRYLRRVLIPSYRVGGLNGRDSLKLSMLRHIVVTTPANRLRYARLYPQLQLPRVRLRSMRAIDAQSRQWAIERGPGADASSRVAHPDRSG